MTDTAPGQPPRLEQLRRGNPTFGVHPAKATAEGGNIQIRFTFTVGERSFEPEVHIAGFTSDEVDRLGEPTAQSIIRALAIVEAFSYWKAFCSENLSTPAGPWDEPKATAESAWWNGFWPNAMGEFFYRNNIDFTAPGFLTVGPQTPSSAAAGTQPPETANDLESSNSRSPEGPALVMFSGGKDSLALVKVTQKAMPVDFFLYNPTDGQKVLTGKLQETGSRVFTVRRSMLPELLELNAQGYPNGHTPYSAYLAFAAMLCGYLRGNSMVLAGNSRSDDEPNVSAYLGRTINHQWTKSYEYEHALATYRTSWLPQAPYYSSPLRPLYELQIISLLADDIESYLATASCNKMKSKGWCRKCAKCSWVFLATSALFGHELAIHKVGSDLFQDTELADLFERMAGLHGTKPFECTGTEDEVRGAIQHVITTHQTTPPALLNASADARIANARSLAAVLADWGSDDLVPEALAKVVRP